MALGEHPPLDAVRATFPGMQSRNEANSTIFAEPRRQAGEVSERSGVVRSIGFPSNGPMCRPWQPRP